MVQKVLVFIVALTCGITDTVSSPQLIRKPFTLEELVPLQPQFHHEQFVFQWLSDTEYIVEETESVNKYDAVTNTYTTILGKTDLFNLRRFHLADFSNDQKYFLLTSHEKKVYRYSAVAEYSVYNIEDKSIRNISQGPLQVVLWGKHNSLAYVQNNNVYYVPDVANPEMAIALTTDGVNGQIYHGVTDWIYEEEVFNAAKAIWFSPNGLFLAVASFNDSLVESIVFPYYGESSKIDYQYPKMVHLKYPKVGRTNPDVQLRVFKLNEPGSKPMVIPAPVDIVGLDHILGRVKWATDHNLIVLWVNRRQNVSALINCNIKLDKCSILKQETEPSGWVDIREPFFDVSGTQMLNVQPLPYNEQRYMHVGRFDFNSLHTEDLSPGNSTVTEILGWNQVTDTVYYIISPGTEPWKRELWATSKGNTKCITCKKHHCNTAEGDFSPGGSYGIVTCSETNVPPVTYFYTSQNDSMKLLTDNSRLADLLSHFKVPMVMFNTMLVEKDAMSHIKLLLPSDMESGKKYPMVINLYSAPGTTTVKDSYNMEYYNMYLASNRSFIVASIDVRGSGAMGVEAMHALNNALGTVEVTDTLAAISHLIATYDYIDPKRIGVWGWSYGGFTTTMSLIKDEKKLLACGTAIAPVTSWLYYDSIYTERYMDTPQNNPEGYNNSDVMIAAEKLRGRQYLLIHGTGDDNVHFQHSMQLAKKLQRADIAFEQMSYADENHSLRGVSRHFYHTLDHFWTKCFQL